MYLKYKKYVWYGVIGLVLIGGYVFLTPKGSGNYKTFSASRTSLEDKVLFSGNVIPAEKVTLSFEKSGRIAWLPAYVGKAVYAGEVLASLSSGDSGALLDQAKASLLSEQAKLADLKSGARPESVDIAKTKVATAQSSLAASAQGLRDALTDAYTKADDAVHNTLDPLYTNNTSSSPSLTLTIPDSQLKNSLENLRAVQEKTLTTWKGLNDANYPDLSDSALRGMVKNLTETKTLLDGIAIALATALSSGSVTQANLDVWRSAVGIARITISASINKLNVAGQSYIASQSALTLAQQDLALVRAGSTAEAILSQEAIVATAVAKVSQYQAEANKSVLISPIDGVVSTRDTELGQIVSPNQQIVSVISKKNFQIESNVSELDIGKLSLGQFASTTLDAYGAEAFFPAKIIRIDPAETTVQGSPAYGVRLEFVSEDPRIKSGMTANISIVIARKDNVIAVPIRTIKKVGDKTTVSILGTNKVVQVKEIVTGLVSPSGMIEVKSGLVENDQVILPQGL
jgi:RND family efflux transporter MFP subunit